MTRCRLYQDLSTRSNDFPIHVLCAVRARRRLMTVGSAPALPSYEENNWIELLGLFNEML